VTVFRTYQYTKRYDVERDPAKINTLFRTNPSFTIENRMEIMHLYNIQYILTDSTPLKNFYLQHPEYFSAETVQNFWLIEFHDEAQ
jgi:hypothetical protein